MNKSSFFSKIQSWFKADQSGRYLALILCEINELQPDALRDVLCDAWKLGRRELQNVSFRPEFVFQGKRSKRRADIAVFGDPDDLDPIGLIEIKYRDRLIAETDIAPAQIDDYEAWAGAGDSRRVLVLSRETLHLRGVETRTWTQVAALLRKRASESELIDLLVKHLEEEGIVMQNVQTRAVVGFIKRFLCTRGGSGRQAGNVEGPTEFGKLLKNLQLLSGRFNGHFKDSWRAAGERHDEADDPSGTKGATVDFDWYSKLRQKTESTPLIDTNYTVLNELRDGGEVDLYARHALGSGDGWLRIGYGFRIVVRPSSSHEKANLPHAYVYAWANGQEISRQAKEFTKEKKLRSFEMITSRAESSIDQIEVLVRAQLVLLLTELNTYPKLLDAKQRTAIRKLSKAIATA